MKSITLILFTFLLGTQLFAFDRSVTTVSTSEEALTFLKNEGSLPKSVFWRNVQPDIFLENVKKNISNPLSLYEGSNTNFCSYSAIVYFGLHDDPLGYAKFITTLYKDGKARWGKALIKPSDAVRKAAGTLKYKGELEINPADQMVFLSLADRFKGYINFLNLSYDPGDENTFWSACNYHKFNKILKTIYNYKVTANGYDLLHPPIDDLYSYLKNKLSSGTTALFLNNTYLYKKNHAVLKPGVPTHFVILMDISKTTDDLITITYWDYGFRTVRQISPAFLHKIVFGITHCEIINAHE